MARDSALQLIGREGWSEIVEAHLLRLQDGAGADLRLFRADRPGWRLLIEKPVDQEIAALVPRPSRYGGWIDRVGLWRASAAFAILA
ncbi:MAG TPA: hypothetical protein VM326_05185, partial [Sphingomicrobium sp.]|nr:hypothetical protein [Sphingomicrobium sp.]